MTPGERIVYLREQHNLSQLELANKIKLNNSVLNRIEKGIRAIRDDELVSIANFFGVSTDYILTGKKTLLPASQKPEPFPKDLNKFLQQSEIIFDGDAYNLDDEERAMVMQSLKVAFYAAKKANKRKKDDTHK